MAKAKYWNGSEWVEAPWKTHNNGEWVEQSKVWDGSEWVPIKGTPPAVAFDAVGAGNAAVFNVTGNQSFSWQHTASGDRRAVVVSVAAYRFAGNVDNITVTYGGQPMTTLAARGFDNQALTQSRTQQFVLLNPPAGAQTVQVTLSIGGFVAVLWAVGNSVSYNHVDSFTQAASSHGSGGSRSLTVTTASEGDMVAQAFGHGISSTMSGYSQTQRSSMPSVAGSSLAILIGDSDEGDNNIVFTATGASISWSGVSVILHPA